jgi:hypothetical protein
VALRNDGKPTFSPRADPVIVDVLPGSAAGKVTPFDLLADAYQKKRARLGEDPVAAAKWQAAMSGLGDLYLTARPQGGGVYKLATPRLRPITLAALDLLRDRVSAHGSAMDLPSWVRGSLYPDIEQALTGPLWAASADLVTQVATSQPAKTQLYRLLAAVLADPGPTSRDAPRFQALLYAATDGIQLLADDGDLVPIVRPLAPLLAPTVAEAVLGILRRSLPSDDKQVLQKLGQNLFSPDPSGRYPAFYLGEALSEINRSGAGQPGVWGATFTASDYQALLATVGSFLRDERRGVRRLLDIISTRHGD